MGATTKVDWCDATWNPVTGCMHGCEYCYARKIAERFKGCDGGSTYGICSSTMWHRVNPDSELKDAIFEINKNRQPVNKRFDAEKQITIITRAPYPWGFQPTLHKYRLDEPQKWKKPRNIFVCSMADLFGNWVPDEWIQEVFKACEAAPQHRYLFLTKNPSRYLKLVNKGLLVTKENFWYGYSATKSADIVPVSSAIQNAFISIEPIHENIEETRLNLVPLKVLTDWIIVGAETGNRKGKVIPKREWIEHLSETCRKSNVPLFMKESLRDLMGDDFRQEFPWEVK